MRATGGTGARRTGRAGLTRRRLVGLAYWLSPMTLGLQVSRTSLHFRRNQDLCRQAYEELYESGKSKRFPPGMWERALRRLEYLDLATSVTDLKIPLSNRLHKSERDRAGQYSISVNDQWRVCFRFEDGDAYEVVITDYH